MKTIDNLKLLIQHHWQKLINGFFFENKVHFLFLINNFFGKKEPK